MKIVAIICNIILFGFICFVLATEGPPRGTAYIVFTLWSILTLILSLVLISRTGAGKGLPGILIKRKVPGEQRKIEDLISIDDIKIIVVIVFNMVFFGFVCWAIVDQYPHPKESGVIIMAVLMLVTPVLNLVTIFKKGTKNI
jgi:hypothetical protein